jgi:hypothetical protein
MNKYLKSFKNLDIEKKFQHKIKQIKTLTYFFLISKNNKILIYIYLIVYTK